MVIFTSPPDNLDLGASLIDGVTVTGYFLKLYTYVAKDQKVRFAPLVLADTVHVQEFSGLVPIAPGWTIYAGLGAVAALLAAAMWRARRSDRRHRERQVRHVEPESPPDFDALKDIT
jgi:hypothetical protein